MAIETRKGKKKTAYRVFWTNPVTHAREHQTFHDKMEAETFDLSVRKRLKKDPGSFGAAPPEESPTFKTVGMAYLKEKGLAPSTWETTYIALTKEILPHIGAIEAEKLTKEDLKGLEGVWRAKGNKQITINRKISIIKAALSWAEEEGRIQTHPLPRYTCKRGPVEKLPPPTPQELQRIYDESPGHLVRVIVLGSGLGMRVGQSELLQLKWEDVDFEQGIIRVWSALKNLDRPWRDVHLTPAMAQCLAVWKTQDGPKMSHIVHYRGKPVASIKTAWGKAKESAGITRRIRPYDLRHYFATQSIGSGADVKAVADIMGHSTTRLTQDTYQHALEGKRKEAVGMVKVPGQDLGHFSGHSEPQEGSLHVPETTETKQ